MMASVTDINFLARQSTQHVTVSHEKSVTPTNINFYYTNMYIFTFHYNKTKPKTLVKE